MLSAIQSELLGDVECPAVAIRALRVHSWDGVTELPPKDWLGFINA